MDELGPSRPPRPAEPRALGPAAGGHKRPGRRSRAGPDPTIRLMTCGGTFNPTKRSYNDNIIVYGVLVGWTMS
ncbi:hypothetical protein GCM10009527_027890 [Actinomadura nitritigenes]